MKKRDLELKSMELLHKFSIENGGIIRGTSDLSPLEQWLLRKLCSAEMFFDGVNIKIEMPSYYYNSTESINSASEKITFTEDSIEILKDIKGYSNNPFNK